MLFSIYKVTNKVNDLVYIGFTKNTPQQRFNGHVAEANSPNDPKTNRFHNALRKYGKDNFTVELLYQSSDESHTIDVMEPHYIKEYNSYLGEGYNLTPGGDRGPRLFGKDNPFYGKKHTDATKAKMSASSKGQNVGEKNGMANPEHRAKVGRKGHKRSVGEKNGMHGRKHTAESILLMKQKRWPNKYPIENQ
jgi:group I intron endonuclease